MSSNNRVMVIGLDAAEPRLVERWIADGLLPNLERLKSQGVYARIGSPDDHLVGLPWPTFYRGVNPGKHGIYHYLQWSPDTMTTRRLCQSEYNLLPFWRRFGKNDPRAIVIDVPLAAPPADFNGIEIMGWATHEVLYPLCAFPADIMRAVEKAVGPSPAFDERYGSFTYRELMQIENKLRHLTRQVTDLADMLMRKEDWDLFMVVYSAPHRGGHQLWDGTNVADPRDEATRKRLGRSLLHVYQACDQSIGRLLDRVPEDVTVIVCSLHGMGPNNSCTEILPEMMSRLLSVEWGATAGQRPKISTRLRELIPETWRHAVKHRLPYKWQDRFTSFWRMGATDWPKTPVITLLGDYDGYLQINRRGREAGGIVNPEDVAHWTTRVSRGLKSYVDVDTGEPIVKAVLQREDLGLKGESIDRFPDMIVQWEETPASRRREIVSPDYGSVLWPTLGRNPEGRSGNHRPQGFVLIRGDQFRSDFEVRDIGVVDLAPTILGILGAAIPPEMDGRALGS